MKTAVRTFPVYLRSVQRTTLTIKTIAEPSGLVCHCENRININRCLFENISSFQWGRRKFIKVILAKIGWLTWYDVKCPAQSFGQFKIIPFSGQSLLCFRLHVYFNKVEVRIGLFVKNFCVRFTSWTPKSCIVSPNFNINLSRSIGQFCSYLHFLTFRPLMSSIVDVPQRKPPKLYFIYLFNKYRYRIF
jgi:hypothetical protein